MTFHDKPLPSLVLAAVTLPLALILIMSPLSHAKSAAGEASGPRPPRQYFAQDGHVVAQGYGVARPPSEIGEGNPAPEGGPEGDGTRLDSASLLVRIGRLESQMRQLNGQIEEMQFETRRLEEQLRKFQEDVDFRLREATPPAPSTQKRGDAGQPQNGSEGGYAQPAAPASSRLGRRGDAFDPAQNPSAPGAPHPLGSTASAAPPSERARKDSPAGTELSDPGAPLDLPGAHPHNAPGSSPERPPASAGNAAPSGTVIAALPSSSKEELDIAFAYFRQRAFENAAKGFAHFLGKYPKDKMKPEAIYYLGESYFLLGRQREAAEQYLKISADYPASPHAPEALLRLGQSLNALGAKEQACATFNEISRKYPNAPATIKTNAQKEAKRAQC